MKQIFCYECYSNPLLQNYIQTAERTQGNPDNLPRNKTSPQPPNFVWWQRASFRCRGRAPAWFRRSPPSQGQALGKAMGWLTEWAIAQPRWAQLVVYNIQAMNWFNFPVNQRGKRASTTQRVSSLQSEKSFGGNIVNVIIQYVKYSS